MKTENLQISGMECEKCRERIEKALCDTQGITAAAVSYTNANALVTYDENIISYNALVAVITGCGYRVVKNGASPNGQTFVAYALFVAALYMLYQHLGVSQAANAMPVVGSGMGYAMLFVLGLFTSVHCVAMCGGINLSQTISESVFESAKRPLFPAFLYNGGRIISYTLTGIIVGALGQAITVTPFMQGALQIFAGAFMLLMAVNMIGFFKPLRAIQTFLTPHLPKALTEKLISARIKNKGPLVVGLLNGLMPCGPLQAMQLYALSTASPISGGISMFLFSMGTVPLMFFVGALGSLLNMKFKQGVMKVGSILVAVLGLAMFTNGYVLSGLPLMGNITLSGSVDKSGLVPVIKDGVQIIESTLSGGRYPAITVQEGVPVKWIINAPQGSINGCNNRMIIREYGITHTFKPGENVIEFMPQKSGRFSFSCWMGMIRSTITVLEAGQTEADIVDDSNPKPAGVLIPTETFAIAHNESSGIQTVSLNLTDDGFEPAVAVVQKNKKTKFIINNQSFDKANYSLVFPVYYAQLDIDEGENVLGIVPDVDFEFSTGDNIYYAYVKVVDDINKVDTDALKSEVSNHETLIYPQSYFDEANAASGGGCCGR